MPFNRQVNCASPCKKGCPNRTERSECRKTCTRFQEYERARMKTYEERARQQLINEQESNRRKKARNAAPISVRIMRAKLDQEYKKDVYSQKHAQLLWEQWNKEEQMNPSPFYSEHPLVEAPPDWRAEYQKVSEKLNLCRKENEQLRAQVQSKRAGIDVIHAGLTERPTPDRTTQAVELQELNMRMELLIIENKALQETLKVICRHYPEIRKIVDKEKING